MFRAQDGEHHTVDEHRDHKEKIVAAGTATCPAIKCTTLAPRSESTAHAQCTVHEGRGAQPGAAAGDHPEGEAIIPTTVISSPTLPSISADTLSPDIGRGNSRLSAVVAAKAVATVGGTTDWDSRGSSGTPTVVTHTTATVGQAPSGPKGGGGETGRPDPEPSASARSKAEVTSNSDFLQGLERELESLLPQDSASESPDQPITQSKDRSDANTHVSHSSSHSARLRLEALKAEQAALQAQDEQAELEHQLKVIKAEQAAKIQMLEIERLLEAKRREEARKRQHAEILNQEAMLVGSEQSSVQSRVRKRQHSRERAVVSDTVVLPPQPITTGGSSTEGGLPANTHGLSGVLSAQVVETTIIVSYIYRICLYERGEESGEGELYS